MVAHFHFKHFVNFFSVRCMLIDFCLRFCFKPNDLLIFLLLGVRDYFLDLFLSNENLLLQTVCIILKVTCTIKEYLKLDLKTEVYQSPVLELAKWFQNIDIELCILYEYCHHIDGLNKWRSHVKCKLVSWTVSSSVKHEEVFHLQKFKISLVKKCSPKQSTERSFKIIDKYR